MGERRPTTIRADVVVVGSGPNGLVAAVECARAGRSVVVVEAEQVPGGGCRTVDATEFLGPAGEGLVVDPCSAVHPLAAASGFFRRFDLASRGVRLLRPPVQVAHVWGPDDCLVVEGDPALLADGLGSSAEARAWRSVFDPLLARWADVVDTALSDQRSVPDPVAAAAMVRAAVLTHPVPAVPRRLGPAGRSVFAGIAAHAIGPLGSPAATGVGLVLGTLLHSPGGWPVPEGGSGAITGALVTELEQLGGGVVRGHRVRSLHEIEARDVVVDTSPWEFGAILSASSPSPRTSRVARRLRRVPVGGAAAKVDLVLSGPVPWRDGRLAGAGTIHLGGDAALIDAAERAVTRGRHPERPVVLLSQPWAADRSRIAPDGRRPLWAYAHVPAFSSRDVTDVVLDMLDEAAPGIRDVVVAARCTPADRMASHNANYLGGDIAAGRVDLRGLVARPVPRLDPYATGVPGVWHASGATPPGPGVHGMAGVFAARRVLAG